MIIYTFIWSIRSDGLYYEDENKTILSGAVPGTTSVVVSERVITIRGGPKETDGFAYTIRSTLNEVDFSKATSLVRIEEFAFKDTTLKILNLSACTSLEIIGTNSFSSCKVSEVLLPLSGVLKIIYDTSFLRSTLVELVVPPSVEEIRGSAFYYAQHLKSIEFLPNSNLTFLGHTSLEGTLIERIKIPKKATVITTAFTNCKKLIEISVEYGSEKYASEYGILYSKDYKSLVVFPPGLQNDEIHYIRDGVEIIKDRAFGTSQILGIVFPSTVTTVSSWTFWNCRKLQIINMTSSVISLGEICFSDTNISSIIYPTYVDYVPPQAFSSCSNLKNIHFNGTLVRIDNNAFSGCTSLESFDVKDGVTEIFASAFKGCSKLVSVFLPQSIEKLGGGLFERCHPNLTVKFKEEGRFETDDQYIIYSNNKTNVIQMFAAPLDLNIRLPVSVKNISDGAFASTKLKSIVLDDNIEYIGSRAFAECKNIFNLSIIGSPSLGKEIFYGSTIQNINLGKVSSIPVRAFFQANIVEVMVPYTAEYILSNAFEYSTVQSIIFKDSSLQSIKDLAFAECKFLKNLTIPRSVVSLGSSMCAGSNIQMIVIEDGSRMAEISYGAFMDSPNLKSILLANTTKILGEFSIASCASLQTITITPSVTTLKANSLSGCTGLKLIIINDRSNLDVISESALNGLSNLESIVIEGSCKGFSSSDNAVLYNKDKTSIIKYCCQNPKTIFNIPPTVRSIGWCCFEDAIHLKSVTIPKPIKEISFRSFAGCIKLTSISIADSVTTVGENAFEDSRLSCGSVKYPKFLKSQLRKAGIPEIALDKCITPIFSIDQDRFDRILSWIGIPHAIIYSKEYQFE